MYIVCSVLFVLFHLCIYTNTLYNSIIISKNIFIFNQMPYSLSAFRINTHYHFKQIHFGGILQRQSQSNANKHIITILCFFVYSVCQFVVVRLFVLHLLQHNFVAVFFAQFHLILILSFDTVNFFFSFTYIPSFVHFIDLYVYIYCI